MTAFVHTNDNQMFRVDLHVHTNYSFDSTTSLSNIVKRAVDKNLDCIAITDHGTIEGALSLREMAPFQVIVGQEIKTTQGDLVGLFLSKQVPSGLQPIEAVECVRRQNGIVMLPHPFDRIRGSALTSQGFSDVLLMDDLDDATLVRNRIRVTDMPQKRETPNHISGLRLGGFDLIEGFNARNVFRSSDRMAKVFAGSSTIPIVAVSDAHTVSELGNTYTQIPKLSNDPKEFLEAIRQGFLVEKRSNPLVHCVTTYNRLVKQFLRR